MLKFNRLPFLRTIRYQKPPPCPKPAFIYSEWNQTKESRVKKPLANISHYNNLELVQQISVQEAISKKLRRVGTLSLKVGMMEYFDSHGIMHPVTVLLIDDCRVMGYCEPEKPSANGHLRVTLGIGSKKPWRMAPETQSVLSGLNLPSKRYIGYFSVSKECLLPVGWSMNAAHFVPGQHVDIKAVTTGQGTQGVMKRWGFKGLPATHGVSLKHRSGGSIGSCIPARVLKGTKMAGRMGNEMHIVYNMKVLHVDTQNNYLYVLGNVPGRKGGSVWIRDTLGQNAEVPFPTFLPGIDEKVPIESSIN